MCLRGEICINIKRGTKSILHMEGASLSDLNLSEEEGPSKFQEEFQSFASSSVCRLRKSMRHDLIPFVHELCSKYYPQSQIVDLAVFGEYAEQALEYDLDSTRTEDYPLVSKATSYLIACFRKASDLMENHPDQVSQEILLRIRHSPRTLPRIFDEWKSAVKDSLKDMMAFYQAFLVIYPAVCNYQEEEGEYRASVQKIVEFLAGNYPEIFWKGLVDFSSDPFDDVIIIEELSGELHHLLSSSALHKELCMHFMQEEIKKTMMEEEVLLSKKGFQDLLILGGFTIFPTRKDLGYDNPWLKSPHPPIKRGPNDLMFAQGKRRNEQKFHYWMAPKTNVATRS